MTKRQIGMLLVLYVLGIAPLVMGADPSVLVRTEPIRKMPLTSALRAYGTIDLDNRHTMSISFPHAGVVTALMVNTGQAVKRGAKLLEFSTDPAESFAYTQAKLAVDYARDSLDRIQTLVQQRLATQAQLASARKALADAEASLEMVRRQGKGAATEEAIAPFDGIVTRLDVKPGDRLSSGTVLLHLARIGSLMANLGVEPEDVSRVAIGMSVHIHSIFDISRKAEGRVSAVNGIINPQTRLVDVRIQIPTDQTDHFLPGLQILGEILLGSREYWIVPRSAVLRDEKGAHIFQIAPDGRAHRVNVVSEEETDRVVAISGGLDPGLNVVVQGNYELQENMAVREEPK